MRRLILPLLLAGVAVGAARSPLPVAQAPTTTALARCSTDFAGGVAPKVSAETIQPLCFRHYAVGYSPRTLTPLWSAEKLTEHDVEAGWTLHRRDDFHAETALAGSSRAELADYVHSGYDHCHMTPSADMPDAASQDESFSLVNVVPQNRENNRHIWADIEQTVRRVARAKGTIYVVTGPIFSSRPTRIHDRVAVPVALYKAIYAPGDGAAAYISQNVSVRTGERCRSASWSRPGSIRFRGFPSARRARCCHYPLHSDIVGRAEGWPRTTPGRIILPYKNRPLASRWLT